MMTGKIALDCDNRVLLFLYAPPSGEWFGGAPGGGLEENESFEQAATREAAEEVGLTHRPGQAETSER